MDKFTDVSPQMLKLSCLGIAGQFKPAEKDFLCFHKGNHRFIATTFKKRMRITAGKAAVPQLGWSCYISLCKWASSDQGSPFLESRNSAAHLSAWLCISVGSLQAAKTEQQKTSTYLCLQLLQILSTNSIPAFKMRLDHAIKIPNVKS